MENNLAVTLPPLRRKILRSFLAVIALYGALGALIMAALYFASGITPTLIHVNYDSIAATARMNEALVELRHAPATAREPLIKKFEEALGFEETNVTEPGEAQAARELRALWNAAKVAPDTLEDPETWKRIRDHIRTIVALNEKGMFSLAESSTRLRDRVLLGAIVFFLITFFYAIYLSDGLAERVSRPLKEIAEALRTKPVPGQKLRLPAPTSLELRILTTEMSQMWKRLSELRELNIEEIANQRSKLEIVVESVEDAILVLDTFGTVIQCNHGLTKLLNIPEEAVEGHHWNDLSTSDENYMRLRERLKPDMAKDLVVELSLEGEPRVYGARSRNILKKTGESIGILYLLHDVTEVRQRERLKAEFIGVLSHELKTPLQSLGTAAELLVKRKTGFNDEVQMLVDTVYEDVERIRAVAQDIVQVNFVDPHVLRLRLGHHPLSRLLQEWVKPFRFIARDRQITLDVEQHGSEVIYANIDEVKFPWVISNLLSNAIRFAPSDSTVSVKLSDTDGDIRIEIADEGPGIPPELREKIFDPYFQAPRSPAQAASGFLGLGLTIAKEVVEAHHGKIEYLPGQPNGSVFRITLRSTR